MSESQLTYAVCLQAEKRKQFLLWKEGASEGEPDTFICLPNSKCLLITNTLAELHHEAIKLGLQVADQEPTLIDIDAMLKALAGLRNNRSCSELTSSRLLEGWNGLDDLAQTLGMDTHIHDAEETRVLNYAYEKIFFGNNLPSVTPSNKTYFPIFSEVERRLLRRYLHGLWSEIVKQASHCGSPLVIT